MFHAAHPAAALAHAAAALAARKFLGHAGGAGTLNDFVKCGLPQEGHIGLSSPRIKSSKSLPQSLQVYS